MIEILTLQVIAASLGAVCIGAADWLYHRGRIRQRLHALWVSASSTAICLPVLTWTTHVFLGFGVFSQVLVGTIEAIMFLWIYRNLRKLPTQQKFANGLLAPRPSSGRLPPWSNINS